MTLEMLFNLGKSLILNDEYIENLFKTKLWSKHGSGIFDDRDFEEYIPEHLNNCENDYEQFKELMYYWLPLRLKYIANSIINELNESKILYRAMALEEKPIFKSGTLHSVSDVGIYWSTLYNTDCYNVAYEPKKFKYFVIFSTQFDFENVNWLETFRSRIDFINGDCEQEINLKNTSKIKVDYNISEY